MLAAVDEVVRWTEIITLLGSQESNQKESAKPGMRAGASDLVAWYPGIWRSGKGFLG